MSTYPRKTDALNGDYLRGALDWDAMVDAINGLTLAGVRSYPYTYKLRISGGLYEAIDKTGNLAFGGSDDAGGADGTDAGAVARAALAAMTTAGALYIENGVYNINSLGYDADADVYYGLAVPRRLSNQQYAEYQIIGESNILWQGMGGFPVQTGGVILNITQTALDTVDATDLVYGVYHLYDFYAGYGIDVGNNVVLRNFCVRFPSNQRAYTMAVNMYYAQDLTVENVVGDFAVVYNTMSPAAAGTSGSNCGLATQHSSKTGCYLRRVYMTGFDIGFRFDTEHLTALDCTAAYCNYPWMIGAFVASAIYYPITLIHFVEHWCTHGGYIGGNVVSGFGVAFVNYSLEVAASASTWDRTVGAQEVTPGLTHGYVTYHANLQNVGVTDVDFWEDDTSGVYVDTKQLQYVMGDATSLTKGLVLDMPLNEPSGAAAADISGYGNSSTITGTPAHVAGRVGNAVDFNGSTDYISITSANNLDGYTSLTVAAWVKPTSYVANAGIIGKGSVAGSVYTTPIYGLYFGGSTATIKFIVTFPTLDDFHLIETDDAIPVDEWTHVCGVFDGSFIGIYINGERVKDAAAAGTLTTDSNVLTIGKIPTAATLFEGAVCGVKVYNHALTPCEVENLWRYPELW